MATAIRPSTPTPDTLGEAGRAMWDAATAGRGFAPTELAALQSACELLDLAAQCRAEVKLTGPTTVDRYRGARCNPAARTAIRATREAHAILRRLRVPV